MKRIYVVRHAKSSWSDMSLKDIDRPLNTRGKRDAPVMAEKALECSYLPDVIISSSAKRALDTALIFESNFRNIKRVEPVIDKALYHAPASQYFESCFGLEESVSSVMLFGHNPGITYLANEVSSTFIENVPTCGFLVLDSNASTWTEIDVTNTSLVDFLFPKMFNS